MSIIFLPLVSTTYQCWESSSKGVIVVSKSILLCLITSVRNAILYYYTCYNLGLFRMFYIVSITFHLLYPPCLDFVFDRVTAVVGEYYGVYCRTDAPSRPPMHISARATAKPPSLTSWHARTSPARIARWRLR